MPRVKQKCITTFDEGNFKEICDWLASRDADLLQIIEEYNYPPMWQRPASFETLVHIILEQQVSLASAKAAMSKLKETMGDITPGNFLTLSNETLRTCYFSRQKMIYTQHLASAIIRGELAIDTLPALDNETVRATLTKIKGIGNWTADVYLMMVLQRCDLFPLGDVALLAGIREIKSLPKVTSKDTYNRIAQAWKPYRTVAAFLLWHSYLCKRSR